METPPHAASDRLDRLLAEIGAARSRPSADAVATLGAALDTAGREASEEHARLEDLLLEGVKSGPASYLTKRDWAELRTDVAERLEKLRGGRVKKSR